MLSSSFFYFDFKAFLWGNGISHKKRIVVTLILRVWLKIDPLFYLVVKKSVNVLKIRMESKKKHTKPKEMRISAYI